MTSPLYFRQLLVGRDIAQEDPFAKQMENFVYLIGDRKKQECVVVDPAWDIQGILSVAQSDGMTITGALATHYHQDHIGGEIFGMQIEGLPALMAANPCKVHAHKLECPGIEKVTAISKTDLEGHESGDILSVGDIGIELLHTPGHTPGSICFRLKDALISGDTLFLQGCGRVDLPGGDVDEMYRTISQRLSTLPDGMMLYPGHAYGGEHATLDKVRKNNQMFHVHDLNTWRRIHGA